MKKISYLFALLLTASIIFMACSGNTIYPTGISLDRTAVTLYVGDSITLVPTITPSNASDHRVRWRTDPPNSPVATVNGEGVVTAVWGGTTEIVAIAVEGWVDGQVGRWITARSEITVKFNLSDCIDDGVEINGIRWATRNVDLSTPSGFAASPTASGMFFQWNREKGWASTGDITNYWDISAPVGMEWVAENDPCPAGWRVPTLEQFQSLLEAGSRWATHNDVVGRMFGEDPNQMIFLPAAGWRYGIDGTLGADTSGNYWSSTRNADNVMDANARSLLFNNSVARESSHLRTNGFSIRCVRVN